MVWDMPLYTISDPRELILKGFAEKLANEKGMQDEFLLHDTVERIAAELIMARRHVIKPVCANVDFYSGLIYTMLEYLRSCLLRCLHFQESQAGVLTGLRSL